MRQLFLCLFSFASISLCAQTKKIAFKSHSGSAENFYASLEDHLFDMDNSNFGVAPQRDVKTAQLDSVIFVSDSLTILVTSEYCTKTDWNTNQPKGNSRLWKAGHEKAVNHPLFSRNHSLDSIKAIIKEQYNFKNPVEQVVFVGYDNKKKKYKSNNITPVIPSSGDNDQTPFGPPLVLVFGLIIGLSLLAAFISLKIYQRKEGKRGSAAIITAS